MMIKNMKIRNTEIHRNQPLLLILIGILLDFWKFSTKMVVGAVVGAVVEAVVGAVVGAVSLDKFCHLICLKFFQLILADDIS